MLSNSQTLFEEMSKTLYRAGVFISVSDPAGEEKAWRSEMQALAFLMGQLQRQHSEETFIHTVGQLASGSFDVHEDEEIRFPSEEEMLELRADLEFVPSEIENTLKTVLENFTKEEARLYTDILVSASSSVAQAHDDRGEFVEMGSSIVGRMSFVANLRPLYHRVLMAFSDLHADENAKYLYESNDLFDELKISQRETDALGLITSAARNAWLSKYPEDLEQTVQDYIDGSV